MKKFYEKFCKFEENLALWLLAGLTILVFVSAMMRTIGFPLNWAQDAALVAFAWMIFFGSDIALRGPGLIGVDLFVKKFPFAVQKVIDIIFNAARESIDLLATMIPVQQIQNKQNLKLQLMVIILNQ